MDDLATKAALNEEHDDNSDTDDMPLLEDVYDTFDVDNSSIGEEEEAHEEPVEVKAPEETADDEAALDEESTTEAPYEERVEAWVDRFGNKAHESRATKKSAMTKAAPTRVFRAKGPLRKIEFLKG